MGRRDGMEKTVVVCGVKAEIAEPSDEAQVLSERVNEALCASRVLPLETLVIQRGTKGCLSCEFCRCRCRAEE